MLSVAPNGIEIGQKPLQQRVIEIIARNLSRTDATAIGPSASLARDLHADALDKIEIILALEDGFGVDISDLDAERIETVRDAVDCVFHALNRPMPTRRRLPNIVMHDLAYRR